MSNVHVGARAAGRAAVTRAEILRACLDCGCAFPAHRGRPDAADPPSTDAAATLACTTDGCGCAGYRRGRPEYAYSVSKVPWWRLDQRRWVKQRLRAFIEQEGR